MPKNPSAPAASASPIDSSRPPSIHLSKSFSRFEPPRSTPTRNRASTLQKEILSPRKSGSAEKWQTGDVFEKQSAGEEAQRATGAGIRPPAPLEGFPDGFDELPIELISLTDRFISSLTNAKIYSSPPSIDTLSELYQDFYLQAESSISTHIQALASRQSRAASPAASVHSRSSASIRGNPILGSRESKDTLDSQERGVPEQQMLTPSEISERRKARRLLEHKRLALEEAVERRACEAIYDRIWRHKSTLDEVQDEKLRSRTAALALVGIGLKDLGIEFEPTDDSVSSAELAAQVEDWILKARDGLLHMNESRNPLGKLQHLAATHQEIVTLLTKLHQSSSSADEILPTLIYTLITSPPEGINVVSNLHFIQRFRSASKIDGEAAYCLTNLEAAITFLETVDLATLRSDETLEGPGKSHPPTPRTEVPNPSNTKSISTTSVHTPFTTPLTAVPSHMSSATMSHPLRSLPADAKVPPSPSTPHQRRLSHLFQPPASALGAASDAVRTTADQSFRNIGNTLDNSFKLLFGRLREQRVLGAGSDSHGTIIVPKTLADAHRLVSPRPSFDEDGPASEASSTADPDENLNQVSAKHEDRLLDVISGRKHPQPRDRSADSAASSSSTNRRVLFADSRQRSSSPATQTLTSATAGSASSTGPTSAPAAGAAAAVESMRNLGNTLNPLNRFAGMSVMRGFGRSPTPIPAPPAPIDSSSGREKGTDGVAVLVGDAKEGSPGPIEPPLQRFLEAEAGELRVGEVEVLLRDYQRLAGVVRGMGLC